MLQKGRNYIITATKISKKQYKKEIAKTPRNQVVNCIGHSNMDEQKHRINIILEDQDVMYTLQTNSGRFKDTTPGKKTITKFIIETDGGNTKDEPRPKQ
ncbi:hypothetical protein [Methanosphaera cuniculi]|uniref:Uncharacterized protein n=1 Tax=Methanosphaera cuniculi TaxID=1077256 RepID=A0A2A2HDL8_9EURY|nr:hypothetical protein ASJ82_07550 [Methanosphaera cuniculi]PWL08162.1 hypothetical protein MSCUN_10930 [Methanosphaera cuniculi]